MRYILLLLVTFTLPLHVLRAQTSLARLAEQTLINAPGLNRGYAGICIYEPATGKYLYGHDDDKYFTPASNTKIYTLYAGLSTLGDSTTGIQYQQSRDTLYIRGTGDPSVLHPHFEEQRVPEFLNGVTLPLVFTNPGYDNEIYGPGWGWDDYNEEYQPERSAMPLYGNVARFTVRNYRLQVMPSYFEPDLRTEADESLHPVHFFVQRDRATNIFDHRVRVRDDEEAQEVPFVTDGGRVSAMLLEDTLHRGVLYDARAGNSLPATGWKAVKNIPSDSLYRDMMYHSDNFFAEQVLQMCSMQVFNRIDTHKMIGYMLEHGLKGLPQEARWVDGSGLSRFNLFTPRDMVFVLNRLYREFPHERLYGIFPTGGKGTLSHLYRDMEGAIFAKTGSLSNNSALSGYLITRSGRTLIFSLMVNHYICPAATVRLAMERFLREVYRNY
ncbi:D-alanyl-D-alanine carboxypeptidase/D-alanyl-D-alanine-endopeptidase [Compostibacter hankyongensis]|uniref:D-alanyl-D-alanine carboxypeptidase/D-alanyl-D-alanine-endopeptidase n=1 Tax=Compostibacter hankyongensis TaxID=1007089 RepID=A0ABP8FCV9_9BACT